MFTADDLRSRVRRQPFEPLRLRTSDGEQYDVYHPDLIVVGRRSVLVFTPSLENPAIFDRYVDLSILHIASIETLPVPPQPGANGQA